jgi:hypothetical protein
LIALNRFDEAQAALQQASSRGMGFLSSRRTSYLLAFLHQDDAGMTRELSMTRDTADAPWASNWEARTALFAGRFGEAHTLFHRAAAAARLENLREFSAQWTMEDAESHAIAGQCPDARREIAAGLDLSRDNFTVERAARALALCEVGGEASALSRELGERFPDATLTTRLQLPVAAAALALTRGDTTRALELLDAVKPYDHAPASEFWPIYLRGLAHLQRRDGRAAGIEFQSILDHRGEAPASPLYALSQLGVARAAALAGNTVQALHAYDAFFTLWGGADANLPQVKEARRDYARLQ